MAFFCCKFFINSVCFVTNKSQFVDLLVYKMNCEAVVNVVCLKYKWNHKMCWNTNKSSFEISSELCYPFSFEIVLIVLVKDSNFQLFFSEILSLHSIVFFYSANHHLLDNNPGHTIVADHLSISPSSFPFFPKLCSRKR